MGCFWGRSVFLVKGIMGCKWFFDLNVIIVILVWFLIDIGEFG